MAPRWDSAQDIGDEEKATSWVCDSCHETFTPEQATEVRRVETERLRLEAERIREAAERREQT
jgi:hypothetical protein